MKIVLSVVDDRRWQGLVEIEGEIYKVTIWPGSATEEWKALLQTAAWVELDEGKILRAIMEAKKDYDGESTIMDKVDIVELLKVARGDETLMAKIREVMESGQGEEEGTSTKDI